MASRMRHLFGNDSTHSIGIQSAALRIQSAARRWSARHLARQRLLSVNAQRQLLTDLYDTEKKFVTGLDGLDCRFAWPLREAIPAEEHAKMFAPLQRLQTCHGALLRQLEVRHRTAPHHLSRH